MALSRFVLPYADVGAGIRPSSGAKLFFYASGTSTFKSTFTDSTGGTANTNPVIANANGVFPAIFLDGIFNVALKDSNDVQIWTSDPYTEELYIANSPVFATVAAMEAATPLAADGSSVVFTVGMFVSVIDYATGNNSGVLFGSIVAGGTGTANGGSYINLANGTQWKQNFVLGEISVKQFGAVGDGSTNDSSIIGTVNAIGAFLLPPGVYFISSDTTISNLAKFSLGASIKPASGITVTISKKPESPEQQIFDFSAGGLISLAGSATTAELAWFGMSRLNNAADNTSAFTSAMTASPTSNGATFTLPAGQINVNSCVITKSSVTVQGHDDATWLINNTTDQPAVMVGGQASGKFWSGIKNFRIGQSSSVTAAAGNCGAQLDFVDQGFMKNITCLQFPGPLHQGFRFDNNASNFHCSSLKAMNCISHGFYLTGSSDGTADDWLSFSNGGQGFVFAGVSGLVATNFHGYGNDIAVQFDDSGGATNQFIFATNWFADTSASYNMLIQNLNRSTFTNVWAATQKLSGTNTFATGVYLSGTDCFDIGFENIQCVFNNSNGMTITGGANNIKVNNSMFGGTQANGRSGSGSGLRIELCTDITVTSCRSYGNADSGLTLTSVASDYLMIQNNNFRGNVGTNLSNSSTGANNQVGTNIT
jgi:hypothetical protein